MKPWTRKEEDWLRRNYRPGLAAQIAAALGRTRASVRVRAVRLRATGKPYWSEREERHLRENYPEDGPGPVALDLGRTPAAVMRKAFEMGVKYRPRAPLKEAKRLYRRGYCDRHIARAIMRSDWWLRPRRPGPANGRRKCPACRGVSKAFAALNAP